MAKNQSNNKPELDTRMSRNVESVIPKKRYVNQTRIYKI